MNASEQIYRALSASQGVTAITDTIRPMHLAEHDTLPALVYSIIGTDPAATLAGDTGNRDRVRLQIDAWADSYGAAQTLALAVRKALRPRVSVDVIELVSPPGAPAFHLYQALLYARLIDQRTDYNTETRRHRVSADYYVWQSQ